MDLRDRRRPWCQLLSAVLLAVGLPFFGCCTSLRVGAPPQDPAPPEAAAAPAGPRFFAVGDTGTGGPDQHKVAKAIRDKCAASGCDFGLLLGDNVYPDGVESAEDPQWRTKFEEPYAEVLAAGIPFYAVLGNHDYADAKDWSRGAHQVAYGRVNGLWRMPAEHYVFESGDATFVALDTTTIDSGIGNAEPAQGGLVKQAVAGSSKPWVIAFGHHPYLSNGTNGNAKRRLTRFFEEHVCGKAGLYLSGHDHNLQVLKSPASCSTLLVVSGGGGYETYALPGSNPVHFQAQAHGFVYVAVEGARLTLEVVGADGTTLYTHSLSK